MGTGGCRGGVDAAWEAPSSSMGEGEGRVGAGSIDGGGGMNRSRGAVWGRKGRVEGLTHGPNATVYTNQQTRSPCCRNRVPHQQTALQNRLGGCFIRFSIV